MQTLAFEIATTFVDDGLALVTGTGRIILGVLMMPVERIAAASDVADVLPQRRPRLRTAATNGTTPRRRRWWAGACLARLRALSKLT
jgi:hypothetical protein